jgi:hypothetical protein
MKPANLIIGLILFLLAGTWIPDEGVYVTPGHEILGVIGYILLPIGALLFLSGFTKKER